MRGNISGAMPCPLSMTRISAPALLALTLKLMRPPGSIFGGIIQKIGHRRINAPRRRRAKWCAGRSTVSSWCFDSISGRLVSMALCTTGTRSMAARRNSGTAGDPADVDQVF